MSLPLVLQSLGIRNFTLFSILSSLFFPLTTIFTDNHRLAILAGCLGLYGAAQKVGTISALTSLANELGIPQGKLQGEKASMLALLRIGTPIVYSMLYLRGKAWSGGSMVGENNAPGVEMIMGKIGRKLPFVLNVVLGISAFAVTFRNL